MDWRPRAWLLQKTAARPGGYSVCQFLQPFFGLQCKSEYIFAKRGGFPVIETRFHR
jgi:hypothetical protein